MAPAVFPVLPACLPPACCCQTCSLFMAAEVRGTQLGPHSWLLSSAGHAAGHMRLVQHCGIRCAPQHAPRVAGRGPGCAGDTLSPPTMRAGGCLAGVWNSPVPSRHCYGWALSSLESQEGETNALSNLPSCSRNHPPLLYIPHTTVVKALGETLACVLPASLAAGPPEWRQHWALL